MKKFLLTIVSLMGLIFIASHQAQAVPISYEGALTSGIPVTGSVSGGGWVNNVASGTDFWSFYGVSGDVVDIRGDRLDSGLDTAFSLYFGVTTTDESTFLHSADFGGLDFLLTRDDQIDVPGPFGDPFLDDYTLPYTGSYTVAIGGFLSSGSGPYPYQLTMTGASGQVIPEPTSLSLLGLGLLGLLKFRKKVA